MKGVESGFLLESGSVGSEVTNDDCHHGSGNIRAKPLEAFTLVELLIVSAVIAILAWISTAHYLPKGRALASGPV